MFTIIMFAVAVVAGAFIANLFVENSMGTKRFYAKDKTSTESDYKNSRFYPDPIPTESNVGVYRDPRLYEKTGQRQYRVNEMKYDNHTVFRAEYLIPGDERWYTFDELRTEEALHGSKYTTWMPIDFKTLEEAKKCCEDDKKVLRNETLLATITHAV